MTLYGRYVRSANERLIWTPHLRVYSETARRFESNVCVQCHEIHHLLSTSNINKSKANTAAYLIVQVAHLQGCDSQNYDQSPPLCMAVLYEIGKGTHPCEGLCSPNWDGNWPIWSDGSPNWHENLPIWTVASHQIVVVGPPCVGLCLTKLARELAHMKGCA